jgi:hypothetical protein
VHMYEILGREGGGIMDLQVWPCLHELGLPSCQKLQFCVGFLLLLFRP